MTSCEWVRNLNWYRKKLSYLLAVCFEANFRSASLFSCHAECGCTDLCAFDSNFGFAVRRTCAISLFDSGINWGNPVRIRGIRHNVNEENIWRPMIVNFCLLPLFFRHAISPNSSFFAHFRDSHDVYAISHASLIILFSAKMHCMRY